MEKVKNYRNAWSQLEKAIEAYQKRSDDTLYRDGLIQRFEFTVELAWKSLKEYMEDQGAVLSISSPRAVLKEAYAMGFISDAEEWNKILTARNLTSHVYKEETAETIAEQICGEFIHPLKALVELYGE